MPAATNVREVTSEAIVTLETVAVYRWQTAVEITNYELRTKDWVSCRINFVIRASLFFRHLTFVIRHS
jgi:hypothetical protein